MKSVYNKEGGEWNRGLMPRTVLVFLSDDPNLSIEENDAKAKELAERAAQF